MVERCFEIAIFDHFLELHVYIERWNHLKTNNKRRRWTIRFNFGGKYFGNSNFVQFPKQKLASCENCELIDLKLLRDRDYLAITQITIQSITKASFR